jgi:hypothetical protein
MKRSVRRLQIIAVSVAILVLVVTAAVWVVAVEHWIAQELRVLAAARLNPIFAFDDLSYRFPSTITLRGIRLTSPDPEGPSEAVEILAIDSLTLALADIPLPNRPFRMQQLDLAGPTLRLVRIPAGEASGSLLGYSDLLKEESKPAAHPARSPARFSELFQMRSVAIRGGRAQYDPRDGSAATMLVEGITAKLLLQPSDAGAYGIEFSLDHPPVFTLALRGKLLADEERLEVAALSSTLQLARKQDHYLTPALQKLLAGRDITGRLTLEATGMFDLRDAASSHLQAELELRDASFAAGDYRLALDHVGARISATGKTVSIEEFGIDAFGGHAKLAGTFELDDSLTAALSFEGTNLQIGDSLRGVAKPQGVPSFSGLLGFSGTLRGPLADIDQRAQGRGRVSLRKARLVRLPVLSTIDEALDRAAEAAMKKERTGHDVLSLDFSLDGDRARIGKLRMNSRWYGLRGHGDVYFDSRLDLAVEGGPIQKLENELDEVGNVLGEITETLVRARVTGTLDKPKIGIEVLRLPVGRR